MKRLLLLTIILLGFALRADAVTKTVCASGCDFGNSQATVQTALDGLACGDILTFRKGETVNISGAPIYLTKDCSASGLYITLMSDGAIPSAGVRVLPANAGELAKFNSASQVGNFATNFAASYYKLIGLEISNSDTSQPVVGPTLVVMGGSGSGLTSYIYAHTDAELPHHITFDRVYFHGNGTGASAAALVADANNWTVTNSYISEIHEADESHGIIWANANGPGTVTNNYISASGMCMMTGGASDTILNELPSNLTFQYNYCTRPTSWMIEAATVGGTYGGIHWEQKNCFEFKKIDTALVDHNIFENAWKDGQAGTCVLMQVSAKAAIGCPGCFTTSTGTGYLVNHGGGYALGALTIVSDTGSGTITTGEWITIAGESAGSPVYHQVSSTVGSPVTSITFTPALTASVADNAAISVWGSTLDCTWCTIKNVTFTNNIVRHATAAFDLLGSHPQGLSSAPAADGLIIRNNLFYDISPQWAGSVLDSSNWCFQTAAGFKNISIDHITCDNPGAASTSSPKAIFYQANTSRPTLYMDNYSVKNSFMIENSYGLICNGGNQGTACLIEMTNSGTWTFSNNVIASVAPYITYPATTGQPSLAAFSAAFTDPTSGNADNNVNYTVKAGSIYKAGGASQATDGTDVGVNMCVLPDPTGDGNATFACGSATGGKARVRGLRR